MLSPARRPPQEVPSPWPPTLPLVIGNCEAGAELPMLPMKRVLVPRLNMFHCTPRSRPAARAASTKRTSSITCWGWDTDGVLRDAPADLGVVRDLTRATAIR